MITGAAKPARRISRQTLLGQGLPQGRVVIDQQDFFQRRHLE
jgi:hypothetical protein